MTKLVWALWVVSGGWVNSGHLADVEIKGYFEDSKECVRVANLIDELSTWKYSEKDSTHHIKYQCIQANYFIPPSK